MKYKPTFGSVSEIVAEDREGEAESSEQAREDTVAVAVTANATPQTDMPPLDEQSVANGVDKSPSPVRSRNNSGGAVTGYDSLVQMQNKRKGSAASVRFGESLPPPILGLNSKPRPASMYTPSVHSYHDSISSAARSGPPQTGGDGEESDDLYDPEFGFGGYVRRRSSRPRLSSRPLPTQANPPVIPSAAVISAAAAAVSAGWSESDALAAAIASPRLLPAAPGSAAGGGSTPTAPRNSPSGR
jgi:hypothetical protein